MSTNKKKKAGSAAKAGVRGIWGVITFLLKVIGTLLLILVTTGTIFACIFVIYIKTNLTSQMDVELEDFSLNQTSVIYYTDSNGKYKELATVKTDEYREWVSYDQISKDIEHAVVAIEDRRFYTHNGVDWFRTTGAFFNMFLSMRDTFGGSTVTQQLIKNLTEENEVTVMRKLLEIFRALEFEKNYTKEEIMEWYLNVVYFGHQQYGIGAAARYYFDKDVSELTLAEGAAIVGITNNPSAYDPMYYPTNNKERQENILYQMYRQGYITYDQYEEAVAQKLNFTFGSSSDAVSNDDDVYSYFVDTIIRDAIDDLMEVKDCSYETASMLLSTSGYKIYSTIDMDIQNAVDSIYENLEEIPETYGSDQQLQSAIVITDPYTGDILALSGGVGEKTISLSLNRATQSQRPAGSSIKPIAVYAPAIEYGYITPDTKFEDAEDVKLKGTDWMPYNDDMQYNGIVTIRQAVIRSINTIAAQVLDLLTPQASYDFLTQKLGITSLVDYRDGASDIDYAPLALGQLTDGITVREMATAYGVFVNDGMYTESRTYTKILDAEDNLIFENVPETHVAVSSATAYWITSMLSDAATYGTGYESRLSNMPTAGKTGTTSDKYDRWFCGYTPYYVAAVWTGYDTPERISVDGNPAAQLWNKVMELVHADLEYRDFNVPENTYLAPVPGVTAVNYTIRCVDQTGKVLSEKTEETVVGKELEVKAPEVEGYTLTSPDTIKMIVSENPTLNVAEFIYLSNTPSPSPSPSPSPTPSAPPATPSAAPETPPATPTEASHGARKRVQK